MGHHIAQYDIRNPICDCCTAKLQKSMVCHTAQWDIILHNMTSEIRSVIASLQSHTSRWRVILHNMTSEIRFVIVALQSHTSRWGSYCAMGHQKSDLRLLHCKVTKVDGVSYCTMGHHIAQYDIRNPICDCCTAKSHKPVECQTAQWDIILHAQYDIRNPICDCCTAKSHKAMGGHTAQWDIILHNMTS